MGFQILDDSPKKTTYLNYHNFYALWAFNYWEQVAQEIANTIPTTSHVEY